MHMWSFLPLFVFVACGLLSESCAKKHQKHGVDNLPEPVHYDTKKAVLLLPKDNGALGLSNQLYDLSIAIFVACRDDAYLCVPYFMLDLKTKVFGQLDQVVDIGETNANLNCTQLILSSELRHFSNVTETTYNQLRYEHLVGDKDYLVHVSDIVISKTREFIPNHKITLPEIYYGMHFRLEADWVVFLNKQELYWQWLDAARKNDVSKEEEIMETLLASPKGAELILSAIDRFIAKVSHFTNTSYPVVVATGLGKGVKANEQVEFALGYFLTYLHSKGFTTITGGGGTDMRELNAASEMRVMVNAAVFVGSGGSTFTQVVGLFRKEKHLPSYLI